LKLRRVPGRRVPPKLVCANGCPSYIEVATEPPDTEDPEHGFRQLAAIDPTVVSFEGYETAGRGRPRRLTLGMYAKLRARAVSDLGTDATKKALQDRLKLKRSTFFRYESQLRDAQDQ
jgi:hypothetical protein